MHGQTHIKFTHHKEYEVWNGTVLAEHETFCRDFPTECEEHKTDLRWSSHSQNPVLKSNPLAY